MNEREMDVLNVLWGAGEPVTSSYIVSHNQDLTQSTVIATLRRLLHNGLVEVIGVTHSGKVLSRTYRPTVKSKEFVLSAFLEEYKRVCNIVSVEDMHRLFDSLSN